MLVQFFYCLRCFLTRVCFTPHTFLQDWGKQGVFYFVLIYAFKEFVILVGKIIISFGN